MKSDDLIEVAKLGKTVGLKGFVKLHNFSDFPKQFKKGASFFLDNNASVEISDFDSVKSLVRFADFHDIDTASKLTNKTLYATKEFTRTHCKLKSNEFFWFDIIGCKIIEGFKEIGFVEDIERIGIQDYLSIKTAENLTKDGFQKKFLIPYIDKYIKNVDIQNNTITTSNAVDFLEKN